MRVLYFLATFWWFCLNCSDFLLISVGNTEPKPTPHITITHSSYHVRLSWVNENKNEWVRWAHAAFIYPRICTNVHHIIYEYIHDISIDKKLVRSWWWFKLIASVFRMCSVSNILHAHIILKFIYFNSFKYGT